MMKLNLLLLLILQLSATPLYANESAQEMMSRVNDRYLGEDYAGKLTLTQTAKSGSKKIYVLKTTSLKDKQGRKTLLKFIEPNFMRDSGVLLHSNDNDENLQWLFLSKASRSQARRIGSSEKGQPLFGTDIAYIDIEDKKTANYRYQILESISTDKLVAIEAIPASRDYPYSKTISWVNPKTHIEEKIEYYQDGVLVKRFQAKAIETIDGINTVTRALVTQLRTGSTTEIKLVDLGYNKGLSQNNFTLNALTRKR